ncbi:MAG: rhodanese-like domain-containing protein [Cytophagaceae bacterium]
MKQFLTPLLLLVGFICGSVAQVPGSTNNETPQGIIMDAATFTEAIDHRTNVIVIDIRDVGSYNTQHLRRAQSVTGSVATIKKELLKYPKDKVIFIYCKDGSISKQVADAMMLEGYTEVTYMEGGFLAWKELGLVNYE